MFQGPGVYYIFNLASETALDMGDYTGELEQLVHGWEKLDNKRNQLWRVIADPHFPDMWILRSMDSGQYLNALLYNGDIRLMGNNVQSFWWLAQQPDGTTAICFPARNAATIQAANLHNGSKKNGTIISIAMTVPTAIPNSLTQLQ